MGANIRLRTLDDLARRGFNLQVECDCGRREVIDTESFALFCLARCWNSSLEGLGRRLRCSSCGSRPTGFRPTKAPAMRRIGPTTEAGWKRLVRRLRG